MIPETERKDPMFEILKAVLFGIIEGITEWLPISSTGHLILLEEIVSLKVSAEFYEMFQVVIQLGAILAVVLLFFQAQPLLPKEEREAKGYDLGTLDKSCGSGTPLCGDRPAAG